MFVIIHSVDNFYTAKLTKMLKSSALALSKNITKTALTLSKPAFRRSFPQPVLKKLLKKVDCLLKKHEIRHKVKNYQQNKLFFHKISTENQHFCNLER